MSNENNEKEKRKEPFENNEAIKNLLIISLLKDGVNPKAIELATGIPEKTIRNKFPMKDIKTQINASNKNKEIEGPSIQ
jgi:hypothetical protein